MGLETSWRAIAEGQRQLFKFEQSRQRFSIDDYLRALTVSLSYASASLLDAEEQINLSIEALEADDRGTKEIERALVAHKERMNNFSASYAERISVLLKDYVVCAEELEKRSTQLEINLRQFGSVQIHPFSAKKLLENEESDERVLSDFGEDLFKASLEYEDLEARLVHSHLFYEVKLEGNGEKVTGSLEIKADAFDESYVEGLTLYGRDVRNCVIMYGLETTETETSPFGQTIVTYPLVTRKIQVLVAPPSHTSRASAGGILSNAKLPLKLTFEIIGETSSLYELQAIAAIKGLSKRIG